MAQTNQLKAADLFSVKGWVCLVTGGGTGIGLMCVQALVANGAKVYITGRRMEVLEAAASAHSPDDDGAGEIIPIGPCDVTSKLSLANLSATLSEKESHLDLLICNAGIAGTKAPIPQEEDSSSSSSSPSTTTSSAKETAASLWKKESPSQWVDVFDTNVTAVYFTALAFLPLLQGQTTASNQSKDKQNENETNTPGNIITTSSISGLMKNSQGHFAYNAAKAATIHLTKMMSTEFIRTGIRINSIAPGYFPSEMTTGGSDGGSNKSVMSDEDVSVEKKGHAVPAGRVGRDEEMAMACLFLARNRYVNGEVVVVDGGVLGAVPGG